MITQAKSFLIFKSKKITSEKSPTHNLVVVEGEGENRKFSYIGVAWAKKNKNGEGFLSCLLNNEEKEYNRKGYSIIVDQSEDTKPAQQDELTPDDFI